MAAGKKCRNVACQWHDKGECRLFPGDFGFLECKHSEAPTNVKPTKKGKNK